MEKQEKRAIEILQTFASKDPYQLGYSGGKDSDVILHLAKKSSVLFTAVHNLTTVDAPETVRYIQSKKDVIIQRPRLSMWQLIEKKKMPPIRLCRYCCAELKERSGKGKKVITGVRAAESRSRANNHGIITFPQPTAAMRRMEKGEMETTTKGGLILNYENSESHRTVENCYRTSKTLVNPILDWEDDFLWWYIKHEQIEVNPLYNNGLPGGCKRIGCIGCPMAGKKERLKEFEKYPAYKNMYLQAFTRMLKHRKEDGDKTDWKNAQDVFDWWLEDTDIKGQVKMEFDDQNNLIGFQQKGGG